MAKKRISTPMLVAIMAVGGGGVWLVSGGAELLAPPDQSFNEAWLTQIDGELVVLAKRGTFYKAVNNAEPRYSRSASSTMTLLAHRVRDEAPLGEFELGGADVVGLTASNVWLEQNGAPRLLSLPDLKPVAARSDILRALDGATGGDFAIANPRFDPYTKRLRVEGADGKTYGVDDRLTAEAVKRIVVPDDYRPCIRLRSRDLLEPTFGKCLTPGQYPVAKLITSRKSALDKKPANLDPQRLLLSGLSEEGTIRWSKPMVDYLPRDRTGRTYLGVHEVGGKVYVLGATDGPQLHIVTLDLETGAPASTKTLFADPATPEG